MMSGRAINYEQASTYYEHSADYYTVHQSNYDKWHGKLAKRLKLTGELSKGEFEAFYRNISEGERRKRIGFDATFSAPKSVSLALAESDERREEIIRIHQTAAERVLKEIEKNHLRTRSNGKKLSARKVGMYTEMVFPNADVRFIAVNNGVDSDNQGENDLTPFINIFNEFYAKDTSRKIKAVFRAKGETGRHLTNIPPYGYRKSPEDKSRWIVDEEAAKVVREIFHLCVQGYGVSQIATQLSNQHIMNPSAHARAHGIHNLDTRTVSDECWWQPATVSLILSRQEYLGHTVNFKTYRKSYKQKKKLQRDSSEWQIFRNTHDPIVDQETFDIVQRIRAGRSKMTPAGEPSMLSGMLYCPDCGRKMYQARMRSRKPPIDYFVCSSYRKIRNGCTRHFVRNDLVEEILLDALRNVTTYARELDCTEEANRFLAQVRKYSNIKELNAEVIREFVDRIYVHEKQVVGGKKSQEIRILWNCIGEFVPPKDSGNAKK